MIKEERIIRLKRGIDSPETPEHIRKNMQELLDELEREALAPTVDLEEMAKKTEQLNKEKERRERANAKNRERRAAKKASTPTPPPPPHPPREFTAEEKATRIAEIRARREKRKQEPTD